MWGHLSDSQSLAEIGSQRDGIGQQQYSGRLWHLTGAQLCQEMILHTVRPPPIWTVDTRQNRSMLSYCSCQILSIPSQYQQTLRLSNQTRPHSSNLLLSHFNELSFLSWKVWLEQHYCPEKGLEFLPQNPRDGLVWNDNIIEMNELCLCSIYLRTCGGIGCEENLGLS